MKTLIFSSLALVGLLLVGLQHHQLRELRADNAKLQQDSAEANQLKADLEKSNADETQDEDEIARLREENHSLLKLRNEVNQLREARAQFEQASAENQRLLAQVKAAAKIQAKQSVKPVTIQISRLFDRGLNTPENAIQTYYWAVREQNMDSLTRAITPRNLKQLQGVNELQWQQLDNLSSIEIVARRDLDGTTVQLGIQFQNAPSPQGYDSFRHVVIPARPGGPGQKIVVTLVLQGSEWRVDAANF